jgi:hypothetical protein
MPSIHDCKELRMVSTKVVVMHTIIMQGYVTSYFSLHILALAGRTSMLIFSVRIFVIHRLSKVDSRSHWVLHNVRTDESGSFCACEIQVLAGFLSGISPQSVIRIFFAA